ncbi:MAG: S-adenosylmethionine:tRNA ribosyltransferase-isomerase, partial [Candidatus Falkowbacteria bacterium]|nr:S-adenosylmethionine:tRNA ribosyltransferase-isomerase [Candidatus Falkowbacteria bacterium]
MSYTLSDFDYKLPSELIAQKPLHPRDQSRLLVLNKKDGAISHRHFYNLPEFLKPGDVLVINNSKVFPARLIGTKDLTGGRVEIFLHRKIKGNIWECLVGGKVKVGSKINFFDKLGKAKEKNQNEASAKSIGSIGTKNQAQLQATLIKNNSVKLQATLIKNNQDGTWQVKFNLSGLKFNQVVQEIGEVPLPPYIKRIKPLASDRNTYQTIYAAEKKLGSVAAPTAGLHFTKDLLKKIKASGVEVLEVTLNVGLGTFAPVKTEKIKDHRMHSESVQIKKEVLKKIIRAKQDGRRIIAVGTTTCRTLESWGQSLKQKKV